MGGCLKNVFAMVGCVTLLLVGGIAAWQYRAQLAGLYRSVVGGVAPGDPAAVVERGRATPDALASALAKRAALARPDGPSYIVLSAAEMAALVHDGLPPAAGAVLDTVAVVLERDRFTLRAWLNTGIFTDELLGPFAGALDGPEPVIITGPARVAGPGLVAWTPDAFTIRQFPFPEAAVPRLVNRITGRADGAFPLAVPPTTGDLRIRADGVTFYRRID